MNKNWLRQFKVKKRFRFENEINTRKFTWRELYLMISFIWKNPLVKTVIHSLKKPAHLWQKASISVVLFIIFVAFHLAHVESHLYTLVLINWEKNCTKTLLICYSNVARQFNCSCWNEMFARNVLETLSRVIDDFWFWIFQVHGTLCAICCVLFTYDRCERLWLVTIEAL